MAETGDVLVVPMRLDAIRLPDGAMVVGSPAFERLPYTAGQRDRNVGAPFLAETTHAPPFADDTVPLDPGVHLHWTLPRALRTAVHPVDASGVEDQTSVLFRRAPDRWLVVRRVGTAVDRAWYVESDYVWPAAAPDVAPKGCAVWPWQLAQDDKGRRYDPPVDEPPWRNVGASRRVDDPALASPAARVELRADGWGDPTFAAFYPACRGVFGFHDDSPPAGEVSYDVVGWYADANVDPLRQLCARVAEGDRWRRVAKDLGWSVPEAPDATAPPVLPGRIVCFGRVSARNFTGGARSPLDCRIAVAATGTEALGAVLAYDLARERGYVADELAEERRRLEAHLDALLFAKQLAGHSVDVGAKLAMARHRRGFQAVPGGVTWVLRPRGAPADTDRAVVLPANVAAALDALNAAQADLERAERAVQSLREQVYADWYRAMKVTDPPLGTPLDWVLTEHDPTASHDADAVFARLRDRTLPMLAEAVARAEGSARERDVAKAAVDAAVSAHNATPQAPPWALDGIPSPRYFAPAEPAIALIARDTNSSDRWGEDGLAKDSGGRLLCRVAAVDAATLAGCKSAEDAATLLAPLSDGSGEVALLPDHVHMFAMDWQVQYAPSIAAAGVYAADALTDPLPADAPTEVYTGRSLLVQNTAPVLRDALLTYLKRRLEEPVVGFDAEATVPVHPLTAALRAPTGMQWKSWCDVFGGGAFDEARLATHDLEIERWAREYVDADRMLDAGRSLALYPAARPSDGGRLFGLRVDGALAKAIGDGIAARGATPEARALSLEDGLNLPAPLARSLAACTPDPVRPLAAIVQACDKWGAAPIARLLQQADAEGRVDGAASEDVPAVRGRPMVLGLPQGGAIERGLCQLINTAADTVLLDAIGLRPEVVDAVLEARPIGSLARLAALPHVSAGTFARLLAYAEDHPAWTQRETTGALGRDASTVRVDPLVTTLGAWRRLAALPNAVVHTLDGFQDALLQWDGGPQLPVADPVGFPAYRAFAERLVRPAVAGARRRAPVAEATFHPLQGGRLRLDRLRLIDTFGQVRDVPTDDVMAAYDREADGGFHVRLPTRVTQAARIDLRWRAADGHGQEWTPHPSTTPICGWLACDHVDGCVTLYNNDGASLGAIDRRGRWRLSPGASAPARADDIDNPHLRKLAVYLARAAAAADPDDEPDVIEVFLGIVEDALEQIHPEASPDEEALALLTSRPLAVVRATVAVELLGPPAVRQDAAALVAGLGGAEADTSGFERVRVPIEVGRHDQLGDGVVAWWREDARGALGDVRLPQRGDHALALPLAPAAGEGPCTLLLLVDPRAGVHAASPLLPTRALSLPTDLYAAAMAKIELRMFAGPLLMERGRFQLPAPHEAGWETSFVYRESHGWMEVGARAQVDRATIERSFPDQPDLWGMLIRAGVLTPLAEHDDVALLRTPPPPTTPGGPAPRLEDLLTGFEHADAIVHVLQTCAVRLEAPPADTSLRALELREGWLRLHRSPA